MINHSPFDDHIKKHFGNYKPEVPPHIWNNIIAGKEKRKPAGFLYFLRGGRLLFLAGFLIITGSGAFWLYNTNKKERSNFSSINKQPAPVSTIPGEHDKTSRNLASANKEKTIPANPAATTFETNTTNAAEKKSANFYHLASEEHTAGSRVLNNTQNHPGRKKSSKDVRGIKISPAVDAVDKVNYKTILTSLSSTKNKSNTVGRSNAKKELVVESPMAEQDLKEEEAVSASNPVMFNPNASLTKHYLSLHSLPAEKTFSFPVKNINIPALNIPCPGSPKNNAANTRYVEVHGGPDYAFRSFNDTANSTYLRRRKESTKVTSAFSFGIRYTKVFNNAISLRAGINYSQINEKFKYEQGHVMQLVYILGTAGDTIGSYATSGTRYKTTHNKYRTIDIPIMAGYEFGNGRLRTNIGAGLVINAYSWQKGNLLDSAYQPIDITTGKGSSPYQFKTNVGIGLTASMSLYYRLKGNLHLLGEPYFRYNLSPANKSDITLKQKYTTAGLRLGLRIDF